ncbi:UvrD-helicase domain-containing protein [Edaphobacter bradus]|uniref:UvrD-helicase domain-containing protein n=1 Tax=Edaphobacter bradus TaxID=2259016 RepID=UPI0021E0C807|nr:UvrD-helicase domain-containing protein [Edaphobacter bradus]
MSELLEFPPPLPRADDTNATSGTSDKLPPDHAEREKALDITKSWIVEAPAGSGKTGLLIQRYLKLLTDEEVTEPEQVLAITFTEKATIEIRERIAKQLEAARGPDASKSEFDRMTRVLAQSVLRRDATLRWGLLERPRRLNIRTIDSICSEVARSLPVLSGSGGVKAPVPEAGPLYHEAAQRALSCLGGEDADLNSSLRLVLLHRDGNLGEVERLIAEMLQWRDQWGDLIPLRGEELSDAYLDSVVRPKLERTLRRVVEDCLEDLVRTVPSDFLRDLAAMASSLADREPYQRDVSPIAMCKGRIAPGASADHLDHWRALVHLLVLRSGKAWRKSFAKSSLLFETTREERGRLSALRDGIAQRDDVLEAMLRADSLPPLEYPDEQWRVAKALFRVLRRALVELQFVFAERGECDFAELGLLAREALGRSEGHESGVAALETALGLRFRHILVDEMQDTSTSQYELIELLTRGWLGTGQTVFLVGDPKQSIYLFRQARVERFLQTMQAERIGELPLSRLQLKANFRSQRELVEAFNEDFSLLFPPHISSSHPEDVPFVKAAAIRGSSVKEPAVVWHAEALPAGLKGDAARAERQQRSEEEAQEIRSIVEQWRARPLPAGRSEAWKIAVLVQSRGHLSRIVAALKEDDGDGPIPFRAVDIEELGERPEVLDLFALTRALLHPADRVAWLALLRGPWCGLELAELHMLAGDDDPKWAHRSMEEVIAERGHDLDEESCQRLTRMWEVLQAAMLQRSRLTLAQWVERTWRSLGGDASLTATEMVNARRFFELLDELEEQAGAVDMQTLRQRLAKLYAEPETNPNAIDLMTIHKAKGLEWDVVIVPALERKPRMNSSRLLVWSEVRSGDDEAAQVLLAPIAGKGEDSKELNTWLASIHKRREAAERRRLFYVACTRAREELHLFASPKSSAKAGLPTPEWNTLLRAAWPAAEKHFARQLAAANVVRMEPRIPDAETGVVDLAAEGRELPTLKRLPLSFTPRERFHATERLASGEPTTSSDRTADFTRPEGSFEARAFGNAVHALLEVLARRLGAGEQPEALLNEVAGWKNRITLLLRAEGLSQAAVARLQPEVMTALGKTLRDPAGLWILAAQEEAASEYELTAWTDRLQNVRLDRTFVAGTEPHGDGNRCLWIVDYKTGSHGPSGVDQFLAKEREKYGPQMETYARILGTSAGGRELRLGLYYPMLSRLIWWKPEG